MQRGNGLTVHPLHQRRPARPTILGLASCSGLEPGHSGEENAQALTNRPPGAELSGNLASLP